MQFELDITQYKDELKNLVSGPKLFFDRDLAVSLPRKGGVYRIVENRSDATLYVGQSTNLRSRIYRRHLRGSKRVSTLRRKLLRDSNMADEAAVNCLVLRTLVRTVARTVTRSPF